MKIGLKDFEHMKENTPLININGHHLGMEIDVSTGHVRYYAYKTPVEEYECHDIIIQYKNTLQEAIDVFNTLEGEDD